MSTVKEPMKRKDYEKALRKLQVELCALQDWVLLDFFLRRHFLALG